MKGFLSVFLILLFHAFSFGQDLSIAFNYVKDKSSIREGGTDLFAYNGESYLITVASVVVSNKSETKCKTVGSAKAKRDMISFVNGSEITSYTELKVIETASTGADGTKVVSSQSFTEDIQEIVIGTINEIKPLGGWYSEDRSVYYFAIYKHIHL